MQNRESLQKSVSWCFLIRVDDRYDSGLLGVVTFLPRALTDYGIVVKMTYLHADEQEGEM